MESLLPYLDNDLLKFSLSLDPMTKIKRSNQKRILGLEHSVLVDSLPTDLDPKIYTHPDTFSRPYCRHLGDYNWQCRKKFLSFLTKEIMTCGGLLTQASTGSISTTLGVHFFDIFGFLPAAAVTRAWRIEPLGFLSLLFKAARDREKRVEELQKAWDFIFP
jgi:hypothetical protein